ncbi:hypothetical protein PVAP13_5NG550500 [Panicum virgatum]|uniref:Uncharacterized protein n=1 Tax=Panicum virgatum TaxID=38727 RepID=A0A8T0S0Y9_PANVG|nr:hypothetical protein PVAP13_5NG550500 [Panicum virgatum]
MASDSLRVFLVLLVAQVCLLVAMAASAVHGRPGPGPVAVETIPACCFYHPECCQRSAPAPSPDPVARGLPSLLPVF